MTTFAKIVHDRRSVRAFRPDPVPAALLDDVLADAAQAPSNCNTQPWETHIVSGATRLVLSQALLDAFARQHFTPDFSFDRKDYPGVHGERSDAQAAEYFAALGIARDDRGGRHLAAERNLRFFGAPHVALLFMPVIGDGVRAAGDLGMYGQTLLLSLVAHGLGGVPQTFLGMFAGDVRRVLGIDDDRKLLFGISFGYPDETAPIAGYRIGRAPIAETVRFHD